MAGTNQATASGNRVPALPQSNLDLTALAARVDRLNRMVDQIFGDDKYYGSEQRPSRIVSQAEAEWSRRYQRCPDDECRRTILTDRLARMEYAFGDRATRFPGLAFPAGFLGVSYVDGNVGEILGGVTIYPIIDDRILIHFGSISPPPVGATCDVIAEGRPTRNGAIRMASLGDSGDPVSRWHMGMTADGRLKIEDIGENRNWWCGAANGIPATYTIDSSDSVE